MRKRPLIVVRRTPLDARRGLLAAGSLRLRCALGRAGTTVRKREGDGASPVATMEILSAWRRPGRLAGLRLPLPTRWIRSGDGWCDEPAHPAYNRAVRLPFAASAERMERPDRLYDLVIVLDWNVRERHRRRGSEIFLHVARPGYEPTEGCVALAPRDIMRLAPMLRPGSRLRIMR